MARQKQAWVGKRNTGPGSFQNVRGWSATWSLIDILPQVSRSCTLEQPGCDITLSSMNYWHFWNLLMALVVAVALQCAVGTRGGIFAEAALCGSSQCPFGPAYLSFENSNCSGAVAYSSESPYGLTFGSPCNSANFGGGRYSGRYISYDTHYVLSYYSTNNCSREGNESVSEYKTYFCVCFITTKMVEGVLTKVGGM